MSAARASYPPEADSAGAMQAEIADLRRQLANAQAAAALDQAHRLAARELAHRTKNILSVVQSLANQTLRGTMDLGAAREALDRRLAAMGRAIDVLLKTDWIETPLAAVVEAALAHRESFANRFSIAGADLVIGPTAAVTIGMALHELETNAIKYGALAQVGGRVDLAWTAEDGMIRFVWREQGCSSVKAPTRHGFGTRLICDIPARRFGGAATLDWTDEGVTWRFEGQAAKFRD